MKAVYKFSLDCGRMGELDGVFVEEIENVKILESADITIYFGEVLGKHSEIYSHISDCNIQFISDNKELVELFEKYHLTTGTNPFECGLLNESEDFVEDYINNLKNED